MQTNAHTLGHRLQDFWSAKQLLLCLLTRPSQSNPDPHISPSPQHSTPSHSTCQLLNALHLAAGTRVHGLHNAGGHFHRIMPLMHPTHGGNTFCRAASLAYNTHTTDTAQRRGHCLHELRLGKNSNCGAPLHALWWVGVTRSINA